MKLVLGVERIVVHVVAGFSFGIICSGCLFIYMGGVSVAAAAAASSPRDRISRYVDAGQMFLVQDPEEILVLLEKPNAPIKPGGNVQWFCTPRHGPDKNGNGHYDNVVSHM
mmetsp:Transcript_18034/g.20844  ORF Transcript_18034/g.20844 Transcript_18034/m.20844 type:complete len:111 (-) Transcript_18034:153-485(-)